MGIRRHAGVAVVVVLAMAMALVATLHEGVSRAEVNLNDGGVWVTNSQLRLVAHLSFPSRTLDGGLRAPSATFDLSQRANEVLVHDQAGGTVVPLDPAQLELGSPVRLPAGAVATVAGGTVAITDSAKGSVWVLPTASLANFTAEGIEPRLSDVDEAVTAVGVDGSVHVVSAMTHTLTSLVATDAGYDEQSSTIEGVAKSARLEVTAVGDQPVWLDRTAGAVHLPGGSSVTIPQGANAVLQQPGPAADSVLVATPTALVSVPLSGGEPTVLPADPKKPDAKGIPVPPVLLAGCSYAAWTASARYRRDCSGAADDMAREVAELRESKAAVFRVNRDVIVLNDTANGNTWLLDDSMALVANWQQIDSQIEQEDDKKDETTVTEEQSQAQRTAENHPPQAADDAFGVRPGRTTTLPVLYNDTDSDGDVLTAATTNEPSLGTVSPVRENRALQIEMPDSAVGSTSFGYSAADGRGEPSPATVTVTVHDWAVNAGPAQLRQPTVVVEQGGATSTAVLSDWLDPDGDAVYLESAAAPAGMAVQTREDGVIEIRDLGTAGPGRKQLTLFVSDGTESVEGTLFVDVRAPAALPPVASADHVRVIVGVDSSVKPLDNDTDPNGDTLRLAQVSEVPGLTVAPNYDTGVVTVSATAPGTSYLSYLVSDGPSTSTGIVRVDAIAPEEAAKPVPENDLAFLPAGGDVLVDALGNDFDPSGQVLVVQSVQVENSSVTVEVIEHHLLRVTAPSGLTAQASFRYLVSNGAAAATGEVTVVPLAPVPTSVPPVAVADSAVVRAGDVVSIPVLDNDTSPGGLELSVDPALQPPTQAEGEAFVSQNLVRFKAGDAPGTVRLTYTVRDTQGNFASAEVIIDIRAVDEKTNVPPNPRSLTARVLQGGTVLIPVPLDGIDPDGDSVTLTGLDLAPSLGTVLPATAWLEYTAPRDATTMDTFTYAVEDRFGARSTATVRVGIAPPAALNQKPVAVTDTVVARSGRALAVPVLANDVDPDGDPLTLVEDSAEPLDGTVAVRIKKSRLVLNTPDQPGVISFSYEIDDGRGGRARGVLTVDVRPDAPLLAPVARDDLVSAEDAASEPTVTVDVLANDEDPDGDSAKLVVSTAAPGVQVRDGSLVVPVTAQRQVIVYAVTDIDDLVGKAVVIVPGSGDQRPTLNPAKVPAKVKSGEPLVITLADYVIVRDGRKPILTVEEKVRAGAGGDGQPLVTDPGTLTFVPDKKFAGKTSITFEVTDGAGVDDPDGATAVLTLPIEVEGVVNTPPVFTPSAIEVAVGEPPVTADLADMVSDPDKKDTPKITIGEVPSGFTAQLRGTRLEVSAADGAPVGTAGELPVTVDDGYNEVPGALPLTVTGTTRPLITTTDAVIADARAGQPQTVDVLQYATNPYADLNKPLTMVGTPTVDGGKGQVSVNGTQVTITPAEKSYGELTVTYTVADASGQPERHVQGRIRLTVRDKPDPPTAVTAVSHESRTAVVSWTAGANNGAEITDFTVTAAGGGTTQKCGQVTTCTITGLTNNNSYAFTVTATNAVGESQPSAASNSVRPDVKPNTPAAPTVTFGDKVVDVVWTAPSTEGSPIIDYLVEISGPVSGGVTQQPSTGTSYRWTGLTNGASYTFRVQARSSAEQPSEWSPYSAGVIPAGIPATPAAPRAVRDPVTAATTQSMVTVSWTGPDGNGDPNLSWEFRRAGVDPPLQSGSQTSGQDASVHTGMETSTTDQSWQVRVKNKAGTSEWSPASNAVRGFVAPGAVTGLTVTPTGANNTVTITFGAAPGNGALPSEVRYYWRVASSADRTQIGAGGGTVSGPGLSNGTAATIEVWAESSVSGNETVPGPVSSSLPVTPYGPPIGPAMSCSGGDQSVTCSWNGGSDNGRATQYFISENQSGGSVVGPSGTHSFPGIGYSATRQLCVQARQEGGQTSGWSCASATSNPPPPPPPPAVVAGQSGSQATLTLTNFGSPGRRTVRCWNAAQTNYRWATDFRGELQLTIPSNGTISFTCPVAPNPGAFSIEIQNYFWTNPITWQ